MKNRYMCFNMDDENQLTNTNKVFFESIKSIVNGFT